MYRTCSRFVLTAFCCLIFAFQIIAQEAPSSQGPTRLGNGTITATVPENDREFSPDEKLNNLMTADPTALNNLGAELSAEGRHKDAVTAFNKALRLVPEMAAVHINLSITHERMKSLDDALDSAKLAVKYAPDSSRAYNQLCGVYFLQKNFYSAADCFKKLDEMLPNDAEVQSQLGASLIHTGRGEKAIKILEQVVARTPLHAGAHNSIGFAHFRKKQYGEAAKSFKRAVEINPAEVLYRFNLGISQALLKNKPAALSQYNALREIAPRRAQQIYRLIYRDKLVFIGPPK